MPSNSDEYRLKWQTHVPSLCTEFLELRKNENYVDVTLVCNGGQIRAHRLLLSACSPLLEKLLAANKEPEATLILPDIPVSCVRSLIEYVYTGEIAVHDSEIDGLVDAATMLEVRGIAVTLPGGGVKRPRPLTLPVPPLPFAFPSPLPAAMTSPRCMTSSHVMTSPMPSPHMTSPMPSPMGLRSPVMTSPTKSLLRRNLTAGVSERKKSPVKRSSSIEEDLSMKKKPKEENEASDLRRCSTPLFVDTNASAERRQNSFNSDRSDNSEQQRVTTTSADVADDTVSSLNSSFVSEAETSILNPQVELSEGVGRVQVKSELASSPVTSPVAKSHLMTSPVMGEVLDGASGSCVFCKKHFVSADDLKDHISRVHVADKLEKQFKCDYCPAAFARSAHLKRHVRTHTGERPYACAVCPRAFSRQDKLKCHMDRHTEEERRKMQGADASSSLPSPAASMHNYLQSLNRSLNLTSPSSLPPTLSAAEALYGVALPSTSPAGSSNPGLPYLQNILDDVQIVRDKKPASYYRNMKRSGTDALINSVRRLGECTLKVATPVE